MVSPPQCCLIPWIRGKATVFSVPDRYKYNHHHTFCLVLCLEDQINYRLSYISSSSLVIENMNYRILQQGYYRLLSKSSLFLWYLYWNQLLRSLFLLEILLFHQYIPVYRNINMNQFFPPTKWANKHLDHIHFVCDIESGYRIIAHIPPLLLPCLETMPAVFIRYLGVDNQWLQNYWDRTLIEEEQIHEQDRNQKLHHLGADSADRTRQAARVF